LHFVATVAISLAVCEIFSVKEWHDLENWVSGRSRLLKVALFDRPYATSYCLGIVSVALFYTLLELFKSLSIRLPCSFWQTQSTNVMDGQPPLDDVVIVYACALHRAAKPNRPKMW